MRKLIFLSLAFLFSVSLIFGQTEKTEKEMINEKKEELKADKDVLRKNEGDGVNYRVKESFIDDFGDIDDVKWKSNTNFDEAIFTKDGKKITAFYDFDSSLIGTIQNMTFDDLPDHAQDIINDKYKDYTVEAVMHFDNNEPNNTNLFYFESSFENQDSYFVELMNGSKKTVLKINHDGQISFFKHLK